MVLEEEATFPAGQPRSVVDGGRARGRVGSSSSAAALEDLGRPRPSAAAVPTSSFAAALEEARPVAARGGRGRRGPGGGRPSVRRRGRGLGWGRRRRSLAAQGPDLEVDWG